MWFQPANTHRGLRSFAPHKETGHMTASNPPASARFFYLRVGGHPHMRLLINRRHQRVLGRIDIEADDILHLGGKLRVGRRSAS